MYTNIQPAYVPVHQVPDAYRDQKRASEALEPAVQMVVSFPMHAGDLTQVLCQSSISS